MATTTAQDHTTPAQNNHASFGERTANVTFETPLLGAAFAGLLAGVLALPDVALLLLGIPAAAILGVGTMAIAARLLAR